jgi:hypothetical protein
MSLLRYFASGSATVAIVIFIVAYSAAAAGHGVAVNETRDYEAEHENWTMAIDDARHTLYSNVSEESEQAVRMSAGAWLTGLDVVATDSFEFGYNQPSSAKLYLMVSPITAVGGLGLYSFLTLRKWLKEVRGPE